MRNKLRTSLRWLPLVLMTACAGTMRECSAGCATSFGADWIIVQYKADGAPVNCWRLSGDSVANEHGSDGIWWKSNDGHLVHISGWYDRVQVAGGNWEGAASQLGIELAKCGEGRYPQ